MRLADVWTVGESCDQPVKITKRRREPIGIRRRDILLQVQLAERQQREVRRRRIGELLHKRLERLRGHRKLTLRQGQRRNLGERFPLPGNWRIGAQVTLEGRHRLVAPTQALQQGGAKRHAVRQPVAPRRTRRRQQQARAFDLGFLRAAGPELRVTQQVPPAPVQLGRQFRTDLLQRRLGLGKMILRQSRFGQQQQSARGPFVLGQPR